MRAHLHKDKQTNVFCITLPSYTTQFQTSMYIATYRVHMFHRLSVPLNFHDLQLYALTTVNYNHEYNVLLLSSFTTCFGHQFPLYYFTFD